MTKENTRNRVIKFRAEEVWRSKGVVPTANESSHITFCKSYLSQHENVDFSKAQAVKFKNQSRLRAFIFWPEIWNCKFCAPLIEYSERRIYVLCRDVVTLDRKIERKYSNEGSVSMKRGIYNIRILYFCTLRGRKYRQSKILDNKTENF